MCQVVESHTEYYGGKSIKYMCHMALTLVLIASETGLALVLSFSNAKAFLEKIGHKNTYGCYQLGSHILGD